MKILLVYPQYPDTFWSFKYILKFVSKRAASPLTKALSRYHRAFPEAIGMAISGLHFRKVTEKLLK